MTIVDDAEARWRRSTRCSANSAACVEVAHLDRAVGIRDSKDAESPVLAFGPTAWSAFVSGLRTGTFGPA
ncbi:MAG: DUF397 domain-containing protein [Actinocatenispora sp.]